MGHSSDMSLMVKDYGSRQGQKAGDRLLIRHRLAPAACPGRDLTAGRQGTHEQENSTGAARLMTRGKLSLWSRTPGQNVYQVLGTLVLRNAVSINARNQQENVGQYTTEGCALMGIIDPNIIAFLQNYRQAQQGSDCEVTESIGSILVDSLRRISLHRPIHEPVKVSVLV